MEEKYCDQMYDPFVASGAWMFDGGNPQPICTTHEGFNPGCDKYAIDGYNVQLYYWPVKTVSGDLCRENGSTITATRTGDGPNTKVVGNFTFTSPSAYLGFSMIYARGANDTCGPPAYATTIPVPSSDLSSISIVTAYSYSGIIPLGVSSYVESTYQVNYADFNYPVPYRAYKGMPFCNDPAYPGACDTISRPYLPYLALPTWLTRVRTAWAHGSVVPTGVYDPPVALQAEPTANTPMLTKATISILVTISAAAGSLVAVPSASRTAVPGITSSAGGDTISPTSLVDGDSTIIGNASGSSNAVPSFRPPTSSTADLTSVATTLPGSSRE